MEVSLEERLSIRQFLQEFNNDCRLSPTGEDNVQLRGSTISTFRLLPADVIPEVTDWVLHYLEQRQCPNQLSGFLAHHVAANVNKTVSSMGHLDSIDDENGEILIDSLTLYSEAMEHLHELCNHLRNTSDHSDFFNEASLSRMSYPVSVSGIKNTRRKMEDRHVVIQDLNAFCDVEEGAHTSYYAIFDGHGGVDAANFSAAHLHWNIVQHPSYLTDLPTAMKDAFKKTDEDFLCRFERDGVKSGCTAVCCIVRDNVLHVAWVGDSQAILVRQGQPLFLMEIHKPERQDERRRIEDSGGLVTYQDGWRVNNAISVSRAIGDPEYKKWISSDADVSVIPFNGNEDFLVVACDGLWDSMTPADVTAVIYHQLLLQTDDIENVASRLVHHSKEQGSVDNISAIVVFLRNPESLVMQATMTSHLNSEVQKQNGIDHFNANGLNNFGELPDGKYFESTYFGQNSGNPFDSSSQEQYAAIGGSVPEKTAFSELPTPPIEEVVPPEEYSVDAPPCNPFATTGHDNVGFLDETSPLPTESSNKQETATTKEIASDIVNTAIETALEMCSAESDAPAATSAYDPQTPKDEPIIDHREVCMASMMEMVNLDEFDSGREMVEAHEEELPIVGVNTSECNQNILTEDNPFMQDGNMTDNLEFQQPLSLLPETLNPSGSNDPFASFQEVGDRDRLSSLASAEDSPAFGDETAYINLDETISFEPSESRELPQNFQDNPFLTGSDSLLMYGTIPMNVEESGDLFSLTGEALSAVRLLQGVPEMLGISETVPGSKTPEVVSVGSASDTMERLAATVENLTECMEDVALDAACPFDSKVYDSVLETVPMLDEKVTFQMESFSDNTLIQQQQQQQSPDEQVSLLKEVSEPQLETQIEESKPDVQQVEALSLPEPVSSTDVFNLQQSLPAEITEIVKTVTEEASVPAVVVESIPESVPEAEGVTEDSDSESKDGGWKYVSSKSKPAEADSAKEKSQTAVTAVLGTQPAKKDTQSTDTVRRAKPSASSTISRKPLASKSAAEAKTSTIQKKPAPATLRKVPPSTTASQAKSLNPPRTQLGTSSTLKPKTTTKLATTTRPSTAPSDATKTSTMPRTTPAVSAIGSRVGAPKSSTMQHPTSTIIKKTKVTSDATTAQPSSSLRTANAKPSAAKPTSTGQSSRPGVRKPLVNGDAPVPKSAALEKKPIAARTGTVKPQRPSPQKETKETVNNELSKTATEKKKPASSNAPSLRRPPMNGVKDTLQRAKATPTKTQTPTKTLLPPRNNKPAAKTPLKAASAKVAATQNACENKLEKEKGSLEENTKESKAVDSGLASPESPFSTQLEIPKGGEPAAVQQAVDPMPLIQQ